MHRPKLATSIHTIATQNQAFSTTVRLAKRWLHSHLFSSLVTEEAVELLVAHLFLSPRPYDAPTSPFVGFLRFLELLATFDWTGQPLIVNLDRELTAQAQTDIVHHFASVQEGARPPLFIATPADRTSAHWTTETPSRSTLSRLVKFAQTSLRTGLDGLSSPADDFNFKVCPPPPPGVSSSSSSLLSLFF